MKWIIDIPGKVVTAIQNGEDYRYDIHTTIAQGIPYEENPKYFPPCEDCNKKMEEIRQAYDKMKSMERPKGEWIDHSEDYGYVECPVCEHLTTCEDNKDELHYCWYCGSRM